MPEVAPALPNSSRRPLYRLHRSTWLLLVGVAALLGLANWPVRYVDVDGQTADPFGLPLPVQVGLPLPNQDRGRFGGVPCRFYFQFKTADDASNEPFVRWAWRALAADAAVGVGLLLFVGAWWEWRRRCRRRLFQITLGDLLAMILVISLPLGWWRHEQTRCEHWQRFKRTSGTRWSCREVVRVPAGLKRWADSPRLSFLNVVTELRVWQPDAATWRELWRLTELESLAVIDGDFKPADLEVLAKLPLLHTLDLEESRTAPDLLDRLHQLAGLRSLSLTGMPVRDQHLPTLAGLPQLRELDLTGTQISDDGLRHLRMLRGLQVLKLPAERLCGDGLVHLNGHPQLRQLDIRLTGRRRDSERPAQLRSVCLQDVPRLETLTMDGELDHVVLANLLSLGKSPLFLEDAFGDADEFCVRAREVELRNLPSLGTLILDGPHLRSLHLDGTPRLKSFSLARLPIPEVLIDCDEVQYPVDGETMQQIGRLSGLEVLRLTGAQVAESHWAALGGLTELRTLELSGTTITDTGWSRLPRLSHLQSLFIAGTRITTLQLAGLNELESVACRNTPLNCVNLKDLPSLRAIGGLDQAPVRDVQLARLPEFVVLSLGDTHPQRIELQGLTGLAAADLRYTRADNRCIEQLGESKQLRYLNLSGTDVTDNGLRLVARFEGLTSLDLEDNCLTDAGLAHLARLKNLQRLNLTGTLVTDEGLRHLSGMQRLELLYLGRTAVRGPGLKHLAGLPLLYKLSLGETGVTSDGLADLAKLRRLVWLRLSHTAIDDRALSHVVRLPLLTTLHLNGCAITPQGLPWLARLPALAELNVADTDLPPAEVRAAFPPRRRIHVISGEE